jgi:allophanate hydrolase
MTSNKNCIPVAICGAHMTDLPLNSQLTCLGGTFLEETTTASNYKLFKLNCLTPAHPGLLSVADGG